MEFGKKIFVGNFVLMKKTRTLSKREMKALRDLEKIPEDKRKILSRGTVPYIRVSDVGGGWSLEVSLEHTMFDALDALTIVRAGLGRLTVPGIEGKNAEAILTGMFVDTTIVGDMEYQKEKIRVMSAYLERVSRERLEREKTAAEAADASKEAAEDDKGENGAEG